MTSLPPVDDYVDPSHIPTPAQRRGQSTPISSWQPYARHFMHTHGLTDPVLFHGPTFMGWIDRQWQAFAERVGQPRDKVRPATHGAQFGVWLADRCGCGEQS